MNNHLIKQKITRTITNIICPTNIPKSWNCLISKNYWGSRAWDCAAERNKKLNLSIFANSRSKQARKEVNITRNFVSAGFIRVWMHLGCLWWRLSIIQSFIMIRHIFCIFIFATVSSFLTHMLDYQININIIWYKKDTKLLNAIVSKYVKVCYKKSPYHNKS